MPKNNVKWVKVSFAEIEKATELGLSLSELKQFKQCGIPLEKIGHVRTTSLYKAIQKKLAEREIVAQRLYNMLMTLKSKKYAGNPDDKITNPLAVSEFGSKPLYTNIEEKRIAFELGVESGMVAYTGFQHYIPLGGPGAEFNDVEFIAGLWRVQKKFPYEITKVRNKEFVLGDKLPHQEHTHFEFYPATSVVWGGNGPSADVEHPDWVVAKYETARGTYWSYGRNIAEARAYLGIELYDKHQDLIHKKLGGTIEK